MTQVIRRAKVMLAYEPFPVEVEFMYGSESVDDYESLAIIMAMEEVGLDRDIDLDRCTVGLADNSDIIIEVRNDGDEVLVQRAFEPSTPNWMPVPQADLDPIYYGSIPDEPAGGTLLIRLLQLLGTLRLSVTSIRQGATVENRTLFHAVVSEA